MIYTGGLIVILKVLVTNAPAASSRVMLAFANDCAALGVPMKWILWPVTTAVKPVGKPLTLEMT